jgi:hypothetical protein
MAIDYLLVLGKFEKKYHLNFGVRQWNSNIEGILQYALVNFPSLYQNIWENQLIKKSLFGHTVFELPVHDWIVSLLQAFGKAAQHGDCAWQCKMATS